jgi:molybdenum cofactor cytidylyltransferase
MNETVFGVILAAGRSSRMGQPKMDLPWGKTTVLGSVISSFHAGGVDYIHVVINPMRKPEPVEEYSGLSIKYIDNPDAEVEEMLVSLQAGLRSLPSTCLYAMICPGDLPTISEPVIKLLLEAASDGKRKLIFPSYRMRRGHPWMIHQDIWDEILALEKDDNVRSVIDHHAYEIFYVNIDADRPADIDTPEDYQELLHTSG